MFGRNRKNSGWSQNAGNKQYYELTATEIFDELYDYYQNGDMYTAFTNWYERAIDAMVAESGKAYALSKPVYPGQGVYDQFNCQFFYALHLIYKNRPPHVEAHCICEMFERIENITKYDNNEFLATQGIEPTCIGIRTFISFARKDNECYEFVAKFIRGYFDDFVRNIRSECEVRFLKELVLSGLVLNLCDVERALLHVQTHYARSGERLLDMYGQDASETRHYLLTLKWFETYFPEFIDIILNTQLEICAGYRISLHDRWNEWNHDDGQESIDVLQKMVEYKKYHCPSIEFEYPRYYYRKIFKRLFYLFDGEKVSIARELLVDNFSVPENEIEQYLFELVQEYLERFDRAIVANNAVFEGLMKDPYLYKVFMLLKPVLLEFFK